MASVRQEKQREREAGLVSAVASLEKEKEALSRGMEMAQERCAEKTKDNSQSVLRILLRVIPTESYSPKSRWWCSGQVGLGVSLPWEG